MTDARDGAFDESLDAIDAENPFFLASLEGHTSLEPQRIYSECHSWELSQEPVPTVGEIATYTVVPVPAPPFDDLSPYATAIADFGPVNLTGKIQGADPSAVAVGQPVTLRVGAVDGERFVAFELR